MIIKKCDICGKVADKLYKMSVDYMPKDEMYKYSMLPFVDIDYLCEDCIFSVLQMKKKWKDRGSVEE